jgi:hypothetical protein
MARNGSPGFSKRPPEQPGEARNSLVISYRRLRIAIGITAIALPFVLIAGTAIFDNKGLPISISAFYYTNTRNILVGVMCALGGFLMCYRGYDWKDHLAAKVAAICSIGAALFPTSPEVNATMWQSVVGGFHAFFTAASFTTIAIFSLFLFRKTDPTRQPTRQKILRNRIYLTCGIINVVSLVLIGIFWLIPPSATLTQLKPILWLDTLGMISFGFSWLTKGEAILKD